MKPWYKLAGMNYLISRILPVAVALGVGLGSLAEDSASPPTWKFELDLSSTSNLVSYTLLFLHPDKAPLNYIICQEFKGETRATVTLRVEDLKADAFKVKETYESERGVTNRFHSIENNRFLGARGLKVHKTPKDKSKNSFALIEGFSQPAPKEGAAPDIELHIKFPVPAKPVE